MAFEDFAFNIREEDAWCFASLAPKKGKSFLSSPESFLIHDADLIALIRESQNQRRVKKYFIFSP